MKHRFSKLKIAVASGTLVLCMLPSVGWSTRPAAAPIAGQITALPGGHAIEVDARTYQIKQGSAAEKTVSHLSTGQHVHLLLDGLPDNTKGEVIAITVDSESGG
jgi:hypothetical protein